MLTDRNKNFDKEYLDLNAEFQNGGQKDISNNTLTAYKDEYYNELLQTNNSSFLDSIVNRTENLQENEFVNQYEFNLDLYPEPFNMCTAAEANKEVIENFYMEIPTWLLSMYEEEGWSIVKDCEYLVF